MMTPEAEQESMLVKRFSPKHRQGRRLLLIVAVVCFVLLFVVGIVIGYFVGKSAGKCEVNREKSTSSPEKSTSSPEKSTSSPESKLDLAQAHKDAVELVSTNQLRDFLK